MEKENEFLKSAEEKVENAIKILKEEFVGIDEIIEGVVANIKS